MIEFDIRPSRQPVPAEQRDAILAAPEFGKVCTDHMITIHWTTEDGWHEPASAFTSRCRCIRARRCSTTARKYSRE